MAQPEPEDDDIKRAPLTPEERAELRRRGLRPVEIWLPDTSDPAWREEMRRQSERLGRSPREPEETAFVEALADWGEPE